MVDFERDSVETVDNDVEFSVRGLYLEGAEVDGNALKLSDQGKYKLSITTFLWREKTDHDQESGDYLQKDEIMIPFYFDAGRHELIVSVPVKYKVDSDATPQQYLQRGVAMIVGDECQL